MWVGPKLRVHEIFWGQKIKQKVHKYYRLGIYYAGKETRSSNLIADKTFALEQAKAILALETPEKVIIYEITETPIKIFGNECA